jgi:hypothetical protein
LPNGGKETIFALSNLPIITRFRDRLPRSSEGTILRLKAVLSAQGLAGRKPSDLNWQRRCSKRESQGLKVEITYALRSIIRRRASFEFWHLENVAYDFGLE